MAASWLATRRREEEERWWLCGSKDDGEGRMSAGLTKIVCIAAPEVHNGGLSG